MHNRVRALRQERGLTLKQMSDDLGLNRRVLGYLEREQTEPTFRLAAQISDYVGVPYRAIFSLEPLKPLSLQLYGDGQIPDG